MKVYRSKNNDNFDRKMSCIYIAEKTMYELSEIMTTNAKNPIIYSQLEDIMNKIEIILTIVRDFDE